MSPGSDTATLRTIPIVKTILLSIITLGIYYLVAVYRNTADIQRARGQPFGAWQLVFWLGVFLPFIGIINYVMNGVGLSEQRTTRNLDASVMWIVALVLSLVVPPIGQLVWAIHYNGTLSEAGHGAGASTGTTA